MAQLESTNKSAKGLDPKPTKQEIKLDQNTKLFLNDGLTREKIQEMGLEFTTIAGASALSDIELF